MSSQAKRQLLTAMFSDMVGYSHLMNQDEQRAIQMRNRMEETLRALIPKHSGKIHQFYGDGALSLFESSVEAVRCAMAIQQHLQSGTVVPMRIGLHAGDVVLEGNNVFGESVNLASRIESFSVPGAVLFSEKVFDDLRNHPEMKAEPLGYFRLKNIQQEIALYALRHPSLTLPKPSELKGKGERGKRSIAVLPFVNMSSDPENEYFSDGISEELLNALAKESILKVTARTSSFAFKGQNLDVRSIGEQLNVDTVLEGSVRKAGNRVRITAQLISTEDGYHLFSETYDRTLDDIFAVQDEIAIDIANKLKVRLGLADIDQSRPIEGSSPTRLEAYNLYFKGLFYWNQYSPESTATAIDYFKQALEVDPEYAKAWAYLSFCYSFLGASGNWPTAESLPHAKEAAERSIALDERQELAHSALGVVHLFLDWDFDAAARAFQRARAINPNDLAYMYTYSLLLRAQGKFDEGVRVLEKALELDPVSLIAHTYLADMYACNQQFEEALDIINRTLALFPDNDYAQMLKSWILVDAGRLAEAQAILERRLPDEHPLFRQFVALRGLLYTKQDNTERARKCMRRLQGIHNEAPRGNDLFDIAMLAAHLQDMEAVGKAVLEAVEHKVGGIILMLNHPYWKTFRETAYFEEVREKMGIPNQWIND